MIRINLLPVREARRQAGLRQQALMLGGAALAAVLICGWLQYSVGARQAEEQERIGQARAELKGLEQTRKQVERFRKEKEEIERKLDVIAKLERSRQGPVRVMDEIASRIPKRMWLTEMSMSGGELKLQGVSLDAEIVAAFLASLSESALLQAVELDETRLAEHEGLRLNSFKIHSRYAGGGGVEAAAAGPQAAASAPRPRR